MASPVNTTYSVTAGYVRGGRKDMAPLLKVTEVSADAGVPYTTPNQTLVLELHGSAGGNLSVGRQYRANVDGHMAYAEHNVASFHTARGTNINCTYVRPYDRYGQYPNASFRESMWLGFRNMPDSPVRLMTYARLESILTWAESNLPNLNLTKTCLKGGSMGGWGSMTFGIRNPKRFAAIYPDRPRWRYDNTTGKIAVAGYTTFLESLFVASSPALASEFGGGTIATFMDCIAYVSNPHNKLPWIGWNIGWLDGLTPRQDHVDAVAAMRAAKRGFAFAWNNGNHTVGTIPEQITASYPYGTFEIGQGYPLFTDHSLDGNPATDDVGGINVGLSFRNVVETSGGWSCEVTHISTACTVKVEPLSDVYKQVVAPKLVTIATANVWVSVSFPN